MIRSAFLAVLMVIISNCFGGCTEGPGYLVISHNAGWDSVTQSISFTPGDTVWVAHYCYNCVGGYFVSSFNDTAITLPGTWVNGLFSGDSFPITHPGLLVCNHGCNSNLLDYHDSLKFTYKRNTEVNGLQDENSVSVAPNPFVNIIRISIRGANARLFELKLYNILGQLVFEKSQQVLAKETEVNLTGIEKGLYFLFIEVNGETQLKRLVKQ